MTTQTDDRADLLDGVAVLFRRWYVVLPVLLLTAFLTYRVNEDTTVRYVQTASLGIVSPSVVTTEAQRSEGRNGNPRPVTTTRNSLMESGGGTLLANLVTLNLRQDQVSDALSAAVPGASFSAQVVEREGIQGELPALGLSAEASTPEDAAAAIGSLREAAVSAIRNVQTDAGVPEERLATSFTLQSQAAPDTVVLARTRAAASVAIAGLVVALVLAAISDALLRRRGRRRGSRVSDHRDAAPSG